MSTDMLRRLTNCRLLLLLLLLFTFCLLLNFFLPLELLPRVIIICKFIFRHTDRKFKTANALNAVINADGYGTDSTNSDFVSQSLNTLHDRSEIGLKYEMRDHIVSHSSRLTSCVGRDH